MRVRKRAHEVNRGQVPNFSTIGSQHRIGLFEVCKSLNTYPQSEHVFRVCVSVRARAHEVNRGQVPNFSTIGKMTISLPRKGLFEVC